MKTIDSALQTIIEEETYQIPIMKVECYRTPFPAPSFGVNQVIWKDAQDGTGTPYYGTKIDGEYDVFDDSISTHNQLWAFYGDSKRPVDLDPSEDCFVSWEGYFIVPSDVDGGVDLGLLVDPTGVLYAEADSSGYPSAATTAVASMSGAGNSDSRTVQSWSSGWAADSKHSIRLDWVIPKASYAKCLLMWRPTGETDWRLVDSSTVNTSDSFMEPDATGLATADAVVLPGVLAVSGEEDVELPSFVTLDIAKNVAPGTYDWDSDERCHGVLKAERMLKVYGGYNTQGAGNTPASTDYVNMGTYFIDRSTYNRTDGSDIFSIRATDARKKAAETPNIALPGILSYDLAGYDSDGVFLSPDGVTRVQAYDSWTLAKAVRDILTHAGFTAEQLWGKDADGNYKIQENSIRLDRGATYRMKLGGTVKETDLLYNFKPNTPLHDMVKTLVEDHGYEWGVDSDNEVYLREANNPNQYAADDGTIAYSVGDWTQTADIDSPGGNYYAADPTGTITLSPTEDFTGLNIIFNRLTDAGTVTVNVDGSPVTGWENYDLSYDHAWKYKDGYDPNTTVNPCVLEVSRDLDDDTHTIELVCSGSVQFAGYETFTRDRESADFTFSTARVTAIGLENSAGNLRNDVIVVGAKQYDMDQWTMSRAIDYRSAHSPGAPNYVGAEKRFILPKENITSESLTDYTAVSLLKRYRELNDLVSHSFPAYPHMEVGDCVQVTDSPTGLSGRNFWVSKLNWSLSERAGVFTMQARLNPYTPYPSYANSLQPSSAVKTLAGGYVTDFTFSRTDGRSIDPDDHTSNEWNTYIGTTEVGFYSGLFADDNPPTYIQIDFSLWEDAICTLLVKNAITGEVMRTVYADKLLPVGKHTVMWNGRWYDEQEKNYTYAPVKPGWTEDELKSYFSKKDPITGNNMGENVDNAIQFWTGAGYFYVELIYKPINNTTNRGVVRAQNADDTDKFIGKVLHLKNSTYYNWSIQNTPQGTGASFGGRWDILTDDYTANGPPGIKARLITGDYQVKARIHGWLDCHVLVTAGTSLADGDQYLKFTQEFQPEDFATGPYLYYVVDDGVSPWETQLVAGETDFLDANTTYDFILDFVGLPLRSAESVLVRGIYEDDNQGFRTGGGPHYYNRVIPYSDDYLDFIEGLFPGKYVNVGWYFQLKVDLVNRAGMTVETGIPYVYRLESSDYTSNKHCVFPDGPGISDSLDGDWANTRSQLQGGQRKVHFTAAQPTDYCYDL